MIIVLDGTELRIDNKPYELLKTEHVLSMIVEIINKVRYEMSPIEFYRITGYEETEEKTLIRKW